MNHAHYSVRESHLSYVKGCRCASCQAGHRAYNLENSRSRARNTTRRTERYEDGQLSLLAPLPQTSDAAPYRGVVVAGKEKSEPQGLRRASSPAVGKHHRDADATEIKAARKQVRHGDIRERVLRAFVRAGSHGLTRHECAALTNLKLQTVCARVVELVEEGWLAKTKQTRLTESNSSAGVLVATESGARQVKEPVAS